MPTLKELRSRTQSRECVANDSGHIIHRCILENPLLAQANRANLNVFSRVTSLPRKNEGTSTGVRIHIFMLVVSLSC
ncbi:hypothetical protein C1H46_001930 [Malus baccata]|uniref:Uncharacterized protein n=1 Tax=Malus baccata TaxID=106549 RepID=A0A540NMM7_MALBA|nr:hypothetical protein C1H46_001930 [Malus baccata]